VKIDLKQNGGVLVAAIREPQLDAHTAPALTEALEAAIDGGAARLVVDMSDVYFLDSSGLGALIRLLKRLPEGGNLALCGCRAPILELLRLTRIDQILAAHPSEQEAIDSISG